MMAHRHTSNSLMLISLFTLAAATTVTIVALTAWTGGIANLLSGQSVMAQELPANIVIGGVEGSNSYVLSASALTPAYRAADEMLPSQIGDQMTAEISREDGAGALSLPAPMPQDSPEDIWLDGLTRGTGMDVSASASSNSTLPDVVLEQAAILEEMRRAHAPVEDRF